MKIQNIYLLWFLSLIGLGLFSCKKKSESTASATAPILSASKTNLVLNRDSATKTALTFTWTAASLNNSQGEITYFFEWDNKGNNFKSPNTTALGKNKISLSYTVGALDTLLGVLAYNVPTDIETRIVCATSDGSVAAFYSNVLLINVTTYSLKIPLPYTALWLAGDATPTGWNLASPTPMPQSASDPYIFTWTGNLKVGDFKILTTLNTPSAPSIRPLSNHPDISVTSYQITTDSANWAISTAGNYSIKLNFKTKTITITQNSTTPPPFNQLWLIGDATPTGWDIAHPTPMVQSAADPFVFTWTGQLSTGATGPGEFKIATALNNFHAPFYRPLTNHPPLTVTSVTLYADSVDTKWAISTAGAYSITLNLRDNSIVIQQSTAPVPPFNKLWIVGDATSAGWNINNPLPMTQNPGDNWVFTWNGILKPVKANGISTPGEFKIPTVLGNWTAAFYRPKSNHPALTDKGLTLSTSPDDKWAIADSATYSITLNLRDTTINIIKQ